MAMNPIPDPAGVKAELRELTKTRVRQMSTEARIAGSLRILNHLLGSAEWKSARTVLLFSPIQREPDVSSALEAALNQGKTACLPRWNGTCYEIAKIRDPARDLILGKLNIQEPSASCPMVNRNQLDLVLVPGIAWTRIGCRLGRGQGHYDRLLADCSGVHCGLGWDEQIVDSLPELPHDRRMHMLMTPCAVWRGGQKLSD